jgi:hypothetical protein
VNAQLAQFLGERRRVGEVEQHHNQLLADRPMIGSEQYTGDKGPPISHAVSVTTPTISDIVGPMATIHGNVVMNQRTVSHCSVATPRKGPFAVRCRPSLSRRSLQAIERAALPIEAIAFAAPIDE